MVKHITLQRYEKYLEYANNLLKKSICLHNLSFLKNICSSPLPLPLYYNLATFRFRYIPHPLYYSLATFRLRCTPLPLYYSLATFRFRYTPLPLYYSLATSCIAFSRMMDSRVSVVRGKSFSSTE